MCSLKMTGLDKPITVGHGEYIVYHQNHDGQKTAPSENLFNRVYTIIQKNNYPDVVNRYDIIRMKIKEIDTSLEITFLPRTYIDLQILKKCIKQDLSGSSTKKEYWYIKPIDGVGSNEAAEIKSLALKLNQNLVTKLQKYLPKQTAFTSKTIEEFSAKQLQFFTESYKQFNKNQSTFQSSRLANKIFQIFSCVSLESSGDFQRSCRLN